MSSTYYTHMYIYNTYLTRAVSKWYFNWINQLGVRMAQKHKVWCDGGPHGNVIFPAAIFHGGLTKNYDLFYFYSRFFLRTSLPHTYTPRYILDFYISIGTEVAYRTVMGYMFYLITILLSFEANHSEWSVTHVPPKPLRVRITHSLIEFGLRRPYPGTLAHWMSDVTRPPSRPAKTVHKIRTKISAIYSTSTFERVPTIHFCDTKLGHDKN